MKIEKSDYEIILTHFKSINKIDFFNHKESVIAENKYKDLQKRLRWDCLYATNNGRRMLEFVCDYLYKKGIDDSHIDTALKKAMKDSCLDIIAEEKARS